MPKDILDSILNCTKKTLIDLQTLIEKVPGPNGCQSLETIIQHRIQQQHQNHLVAIKMELTKCH